MSPSRAPSSGSRRPAVGLGGGAAFGVGHNSGARQGHTLSGKVTRQETRARGLATRMGASVSYSARFSRLGHRLAGVCSIRSAIWCLSTTMQPGKRCRQRLSCCSTNALR